MNSASKNFVNSFDNWIYSDEIIEMQVCAYLRNKAHNQVWKITHFDEIKYYRVITFYVALYHTRLRIFYAVKSFRGITKRNGSISRLLSVFVQLRSYIYIYMMVSPHPRSVWTQKRDSCHDSSLLTSELVIKTISPTSSDDKNDIFNSHRNSFSRQDQQGRYKNEWHKVNDKYT